MDVNNQSLDGGHVSALLRLDWNRFAVLIYGFLMPLITLVTPVSYTHLTLPTNREV